MSWFFCLCIPKGRQEAKMLMIGMGKLSSSAHARSSIYLPFFFCCDNSCWNSDVTMAAKKHLRLVRTYQPSATQTIIRSKMTISLYNRAGSHLSRLWNLGNKNMAHNPSERDRWLFFLCCHRLYSVPSSTCLGDGSVCYSPSGLLLGCLRKQNQGLYKCQWQPMNLDWFQLSFLIAPFPWWESWLTQSVWGRNGLYSSSSSPSWFKLLWGVEGAARSSSWGSVEE